MPRVRANSKWRGKPKAYWDKYIWCKWVRILEYYELGRNVSLVQVHPKAETFPEKAPCFVSILTCKMMGALAIKPPLLSKFPTLRWYCLRTQAQPSGAMPGFRRLPRYLLTHKIHQRHIKFLLRSCDIAILITLVSNEKTDKNPADLSGALCSFIYLFGKHLLDP